MPMCEFDTRSGHLRLSATLLQPDTRVDTLQHCLSRLVMDSPSLGVVKLLCSFSGSIMPRPQDGRLRYVGGETRIVSLPRDVSYKELMAKMRELYEETFLLKYQQPDEDLDALVSVVNDDDVMNMMEEYDKLGSGDGFTRLRIFLFPHPEQEAPPHFVDASERDSERRYVDALNSLNDAPDPKDPQQTDPFAINSVDELHMAEQFYNQMNLEGTIHNQMNFEMPISQYDLHHLTIPHMRSGQHQQSVTQRYAEMEAPWSPAYLSPRHHGHHDVRKLTEFQSSPSARIHMPSGDLVDKLPEEYIRHQVNQQSQYDPHPQFSENLVRLPTGAVSGDMPGFPGNLLNGSNVFEGSSTCEHCQMHFQRNQAFLDSHWKHGEQSQMEQSNITNEVLQMGHPCGVCHRELFLLNTDKKLHHGIYSKEQSGPRLLYNEPHGHERGQLVHHHLNPRAEEARANLCGAGRLPDQYIVNGPGINFPLGDVNLLNGHHVSSNCVQTEDLRYIQPESELGKEVFCDPPVASGPHVPVPLEECGVRHGTIPYACVGEKIYQASHGHMPPHAPWINSQDTMQGAPPYEALNPAHRTNGSVNPGYFRGAVEGNPRFVTGSENKNAWVDSSPKMFGIDGSAISQYHANALTSNSSTLGQGNQHQIGKDQLLLQTDMMNFVTPTVPIQYSNPFSTLSDDKLVTKTISGYNLDSNDEDAVAVQREVTTVTGEEILDGIPLLNISPPKRDRENDKIPEEAPFESVNFNCLRCPEECGDITKPVANDLSAPVQDLRLLANHVNLPEFLDSIKRTTLECNEEVKASVKEHADAVPLQVPATKESALDELETANATENSELESENDNANPRRIEPTKAEEEAISRGLQTIRNDDLEEIRELGSGTYGAVFYGKWKGSDVAIKRIKASCFAGKPSERDRLIADFWKEALILSSLHHPNVVSFYGIVRDGPDGSLATVTEFMVNGSLKQFLKKKDRTIDRRKRLIIGMDAAFGMEYLHGKNVVHFDLKCENLLVNMRDPHRPVCKIGDLGLSKVKQQTLVSGGVRGTLPWMAPELLSGKSNMVTEKIDVYSFGIVMWELLTGEEPYGDMHCASIIGGIVNNTLRPQIPTWCDPEWKSLMENCWASDPADRPSFSEVSQKLRSMAAAINVK